MLKTPQNKYAVSHKVNHNWEGNFLFRNRRLLEVECGDSSGEIDDREVINYKILKSELTKLASSSSSISKAAAAPSENILRTFEENILKVRNNCDTKFNELLQKNNNLENKTINLEKKIDELLQKNKNLETKITDLEETCNDNKNAVKAQITSETDTKFYQYELELSESFNKKLEDLKQEFRKNSGKKHPSPVPALAIA